LHALPFAISSANRFGAKLVLLYVAPEVAPVQDGWCTASDVICARENDRKTNLQRLRKLLWQNIDTKITPECRVEFGEPDEMILHTAASLNADVIIMGLHRSAHIGTASHMPWATAYNRGTQRQLFCPDRQELTRSATNVNGKGYGSGTH
jgi:nucleotide-binding universal stress UspA family protein